MYFHELDSKKQFQMIGMIVGIMSRNITNEEVSPNFDIEIQEYWNNTNLNVPEDFKSYDYGIYDSAFNEDGSINGEKLQHDLIEASEELQSEVDEFSDTSFIAGYGTNFPTGQRIF